ncbi:MAG TPA: hypothetical protein VFN26_04405 [Candidatus Acidoferrum sp.]|nr:hypothetical protein [Candidatus Acidoferrum sp.]
MKEKKGNGEARLGALTDEERSHYTGATRLMAVELELKVRWYKLKIAMGIEEQQFRKSGQAKRPEEDWRRSWEKEAKEVAEAYGVSLEDASRVASKINSFEAEF